MAFLGKKFNENQVDPLGSRDPVPAGLYTLAIESSEIGDTKANDGSKKLSLTIGILEGEHKGKKIFLTLNLWNKNKVSRELGWKELGEICRACGYYRDIEDTSSIHGLPFKAKVGIKKSEGYSDQNVIKEYLSKKDGGGSQAKENYPDSEEAVSGETSSGGLPPWLETA